MVLHRSLNTSTSINLMHPNSDASSIKTLGCSSSGATNHSFYLPDYPRYKRGQPTPF